MSWSGWTTDAVVNFGATTFGVLTAFALEHWWTWRAERRTLGALILDAWREAAGNVEVLRHVAKTPDIDRSTILPLRSAALEAVMEEPRSYRFLPWSLIKVWLLDAKCGCSVHGASRVMRRGGADVGTAILARVVRWLVSKLTIRVCMRLRLPPSPSRA